MRARGLRAIVAGGLLLSAAGCFPGYVVPEPIYGQVNRGVSFAQLKLDAERYRGTNVLLGGEVLDAKILPEGTQIEVLQLPLDAFDRPSGAYDSSEGRFLLVDPERRDPVVLQRRLITVVGEVLGARVLKVDEAEYQYPYLSVRFLHVWRGAGDYPRGSTYPYAYPDAYPYSYPYPYPYYYPYAPYYNWYWDPFYWSGSFYYYDYSGPSHHGRAERRFEAPAGGGRPSSPGPSPNQGGGGGGGRRFK